MKSYRALAYLQIVVVVCLTIYNSGTRPSTVKKLDAFPCKDHLCGCKTESDCKAHCCCARYENHGEFQNKNHEQKDSLHTFISSVNCNNGTGSVTGIPFTAKYIMSHYVQQKNDSFLCFLFNDTSMCLPEVFLTPPEKPPRHFA